MNSSVTAGHRFTAQQPLGGRETGPERAGRKLNTESTCTCHRPWSRREVPGGAGEPRASGERAEGSEPEPALHRNIKVTPEDYCMFSGGNEALFRAHLVGFLIPVVHRMELSVIGNRGDLRATGDHRRCHTTLVYLHICPVGGRANQPPSPEEKPFAHSGNPCKLVAL